MAHKGLIGSQNRKFELRKKLGQHTVVKFYGKSNGNSLDALKRRSDPEMSHKGLIGAKISKNKINLR